MSSFKIAELVLIVRVIEAVNIARHDGIADAEFHSFVNAKFHGTRNTLVEKIIHAADSKLFSYGSLRPGHESAHIVEHLSGQWVSSHIHGKLVDSNSGSSRGFKVLLSDDKAQDVIEGQMLASDELPEFWRTLDDFEGADYDRTLALVYYDDGATFTVANVYSASRAFQETIRRRHLSI